MHVDHCTASLLRGPVLVKIILIIFSETELIKLFIQLILWCLLNNYLYSPNYFYVFYILFFTSSKPLINFTCLRYFHSFRQLFFPLHEFLSKCHMTLRAKWNPMSYCSPYSIWWLVHRAPRGTILRRMKLSELQKVQSKL